MVRNGAKSAAGEVFFRLGTVFMVVALLYFGKHVLLPVALSILLAFVLTPLVHRFERWKLGRFGAVLMASGIAFAVIGIIFWGSAVQIQHLAADLPNHTHEIKAKIAALKMGDESTLGRLTDMFEEIFPDEETVAADGIDTEKGRSIEDAQSPAAPIVITQKDADPVSAAAELLLSMVEPLATAALVVVLVMFLLLRREDVRYRLISLMGDAALTGTTRLMSDAADRVSRYLFHLLVVNAGFGLWFGVGLHLLGVPYAPLWGFLTLCFRFIPYLGAPASVLFPLLISIATSTGWSQPVWIVVFFLFSELMVANVIEPVVFGKTTGLTPMSLLVAALFWASVWGPLGLLLSTPLTVCLVVLGQHLPHLRSLKVLLAEQPVLDARLQYFQRLLAKDLEEGQRVYAQYAAEFGRARAFDEVLIPALTWTRRERLEDSITADEEQFIRDATMTSITATPDDEPQAAPTPQEFRVYGYPVHHESEGIILAMLQNVLDGTCNVTLGSTKQLPSKVLNDIEALQPHVIVLTVLPPGGLPQVKFMCTQVQSRSPASHIIIGYFGRIKDYDDLLVRLREEGASYLTTSLTQTAAQIATLRDTTLASNGLTDVE